MNNPIVISLALLTVFQFVTASSQNDPSVIFNLHQCYDLDGFLQSSSDIVSKCYDRLKRVEKICHMPEKRAQMCKVSSYFNCVWKSLDQTGSMIRNVLSQLEDPQSDYQITQEIVYSRRGYMRIL